MADESVEWPDDPGPGHEYGDGSTPAAPAPAAQGATPAAPKPPAAAQPPASSEPGAAPGTGDENSIPKHRFDELTGRNTQLEQQNARLTRILNAFMGRDPAPVTQAPGPEDERRTRLRGVLEEIYPGLKNLDRIAQFIEGSQQSETANADRYAQRAIGRALDHAAIKLLGEGKTAQDLSPRQRTLLKDAFVTWVTGDRERAAAFDAGDAPDYEAFWTDYHQAVRADAARVQNAELARRGASVARLPTGGPSAAPVASPPPELNFSDADAVHKAAWRGATAGRA